MTLASVLVRSIRRVGEADSGDRCHDDLGIKDHRPVVCIVAVEDNASVKGRGAAAADLPEARDTRPAGKVGMDGVRISTEFLVRDRSRSDDAHVTFEDVEELRQLIQAGFP